jgi:DNA-binding transcriptional LysR family regulator
MWNTVRSSIAPFQRNETTAIMSIELKHLRYAEVAERCGSFRKAADLLALKQSNLSRRVRHLEEELGVVLFERTNGGVRPTPAGRDFVNGARRILDELRIIIDGAKAVGITVTAYQLP